MKRGDFLRSILFSVAAAFVPKFLQAQGSAGLKHGGRYTLGYVYSDGETTMALTEEQMANIKIQQLLFKEPPTGTYMGFKTVRIRTVLHKKNKST